MDTIARHTELHEVREPEDVGSLRRAIRQMMAKMGAAVTASASVELAATELGTNILAHGRAAGHVLVQAVPDADGSGVEVVAVDRGPGIPDVERAMQTAPRARLEEAMAAGLARPRGLGCGLATVERLASEFDLYSAPDWGTAVLARFRFSSAPSEQGFRCGGICVPLHGETASGDAWAFRYDRPGASALVVDGLGHGVAAAGAAAAAVTVFRANGYGDALDRYLFQAHDATRPTRGAAASICRVSGAGDVLYFAGIGNVEGRVYWNGASSGFAPRNGTLGVGLRAPKVQVREHQWGPGAFVLLHSDGIRRHFDFEAHRNLPLHDPTLMAAVLHRDLTRARDDATLVIIKDKRNIAS